MGPREKYDVQMHGPAGWYRRLAGRTGGGDVRVSVAGDGAASHARVKITNAGTAPASLTLSDAYGKGSQSLTSLSRRGVAGMTSPSPPRRTPRSRASSQAVSRMVVRSRVIHSSAADQNQPGPGSRGSARTPEPVSTQTPSAARCSSIHPVALTLSFLPSPGRRTDDRHQHSRRHAQDNNPAFGPLHAALRHRAPVAAGCPANTCAPTRSGTFEEFFRP